MQTSSRAVSEPGTVWHADCLWVSSSADVLRVTSGDMENMRVHHKHKWIERAAWLAAVGLLCGPTAALATMSTSVSFGNVTLGGFGSVSKDMEMSASVTRVRVALGFNPSNPSSRPSDLVVVIDSPEEAPVAWGGRDWTQDGEVKMRGATGLSTVKTLGDDAATIAVVPALAGKGKWRVTVYNGWKSSRAVKYTGLTVTLESGERQTIVLKGARSGDYDPVFVDAEASATGLDLTGLLPEDADRPALAVLAFAEGDAAKLTVGNFPGASEFVAMSGWEELEKLAPWAGADESMRGKGYASFGLLTLVPGKGVDYDLPAGYTVARIAAIPEPGALGLVGAAAVGLRRRRR